MLAALLSKNQRFQARLFPESPTTRHMAGWGAGPTICDSHEEATAPISQCAPRSGGPVERDRIGLPNFARLSLGLRAKTHWQSDQFLPLRPASQR